MVQQGVGNMQDEKMKNIAFTLLLISGVIVALFNGEGNMLNFGSIFAIFVLMGISFASPFVGFILAIPVFLLVWIKHYKFVLVWFDKIKKVNLGGAPNVGK
jgi:hypothetical protein